MPGHFPARPVEEMDQADHTLTDAPIPPAGEMEAFAQAFLERLAGSQGRALRRCPQTAEFPFETRCPTRVSIKANKKERPSLLDGLSKRLRDLWVALLFLVLVDSGLLTGI